MLQYWKFLPGGLNYLDMPGADHKGETQGQGSTSLPSDTLAIEKVHNEKVENRYSRPRAADAKSMAAIA